MRPIKFRIWDKKLKMMIPIRELKFREDGKGYKYLMQYTGLKDKNGKEIYEGDIIDFAGLKPIEIIYEETRFRTKMYNSEPINLTNKGCEEFAEVIGNIYQNKELLEE
jgi:hypothetical protein